jgi:DNA-binding NtrC family response regulator
MKTIMVVDDETSILEEVKSCLEEDDYEVVTVENNRKALEIIENDKEENFGLILIDTSLPDSNTPAFFSMKPRSKRNIDTSKKEDFLQKPFTKEQLLDFIKNKI